MKLSIIENQQFGDIRTQVIKGEPWFSAKDVCEILSISNSRDAVSRLDDDERRGSVVPTPSGTQLSNFVNESGLYNLIFQSRKEEAKAFRKWVTSEVLPAIRKYGKYVIPGSAEESKEQRKLDRKIEREMLNEISRHISSTDEVFIERKMGASKGKVYSVLRGYTEDITVLVECIDRASKNSRAAKILKNNENRKRIIEMLRGGNVDVLTIVGNQEFS